MDSSTLLYSLVLTLSGVVAGWTLQILTSEIKERREIRRSVSMTAATCLGRLKKMQMARQNSDDQVFMDEKKHLGQDSDRFLQASSRRSKIDQKEMSIYDDLCVLLIGVPKEEAIDDQISSLIIGVQDLIIYAA